MTLADQIVFERTIAGADLPTTNGTRTSGVVTNHGLNNGLATNGFSSSQTPALANA